MGPPEPLADPDRTLGESGPLVNTRRFRLLMKTQNVLHRSPALTGGLGMGMFGKNVKIRFLNLNSNRKKMLFCLVMEIILKY